jgi:hypothetical protein
VSISHNITLYILYTYCTYTYFIVYFCVFRSLCLRAADRKMESIPKLWQQECLFLSQRTCVLTKQVCQLTISRVRRYMDCRIFPSKGSMIVIRNRIQNIPVSRSFLWSTYVFSGGCTYSYTNVGMLVSIVRNNCCVH